VQLAPAATLVPQVFDGLENCGVDTVILVRLRLVLPTLVSVTCSAALVVPTTCTGKVRLVGARVTLVDWPSSFGVRLQNDITIPRTVQDTRVFVGRNEMRSIMIGLLLTDTGR
jgi:hypothetical protein